MKRTIFTVFFLCSLLLLQDAGDAQRKSLLMGGPAAESEKPLRWEAAEGTQVLRLWQLEGPNTWPQISVLRVSNSTYLKFSQNPKGFMEFVNAHKVFSKDVILAGPWVSLSSVDQKNDPTDWVLTIEHGKMSTMIVSALPQLKLEDPDSQAK
jgi:hypothetical protein